jgi:ADP-heptose:LPS heptosyltransferase
MGRKLLRNLDKLGGRPIVHILAAYDRLLATLSRRPDAAQGGPRAPGNILVIKLVGLGDTVLMLTPIGHIRRQFPSARITALVTPLSSGIVSGQPSIDEVIVFDALASRRSLPGFLRLIRLLRARRFDCVLDFEQHFLMTSVLSYLTGSKRRIGFHYDHGVRGRLLTDSVALDPGRHMVDAYMELLKPLGITEDHVDTLWNIDVTTEDESTVASWLEAHGVGSKDVLVGIHAGSGPRGLHKRWDKKSFAEIIRRMRDRLGIKTVLTGAAYERDLVRQIVSLVGDEGAVNGAGQFETRQTAALARRCSLFISNDTGAMHIAAAVGTPTIGLFGPETPGRYGPVGAHNVSLYRPLPCSPCVEIYKGEVRHCRNPICMGQISVEDVWSAILRYDLGRPKP